jgi:hypothetical protein
MPGRRRAGIYISGTIWAGIICAGISWAVVTRRWCAGATTIGWVTRCGVTGSRPLPAVILRARLVRPLLILVRPLRLILPLRILIWPLLILIRPLLVLVWPLLISILPLIRSSVRSGLELGIAKLAAGGAALETTLARNRNRAQAEKQDRSGDCRRTHSIRVGSPVHKSISKWVPSWPPSRRLSVNVSRQAAEM